MKSGRSGHFRYFPFLFVGVLVLMLLLTAPVSAGLFEEGPPDTSTTTEVTGTTEPETAPVATEPPAPTIASDLPDYPPGAKVTLTGENWQGDTTVHVVVNDTVGMTWSYETDVDVQGDGTIALEVWIAYYFISDYDMMATGNQTGRVATTTFTDDKKISGILLQDGNANGQRDVGEALVSGTWVVQAYDASTKALIAQVNSTDGTYGNLSVGNNDSVIVVVKLKNGWSQVSTAGPVEGGGTEVDTGGISDVFPKGRSFAMGNAHKTGVNFGFVADGAIPVTVVADPKSKVYGEADPALTYSFSGFKFSDDASNSEISGTASISRAPGETVAGSPYLISVTDVSGLSAPNYEFAIGSTADFTIHAKLLTVTATADDKTYDGSTAATAHLATTDIVPGDDVSLNYVSATFEDPNPGAGKRVTVEGISISGDAAGNYVLRSSTATATASILYGLSAGNFFLPPINTPGHGIPVSVFKAGSTIPVKFQLFDAFGNPVGFAEAHISFWKCSNQVPSGEEEMTVASQANSGTLFRYDPVAQQYIFNLSTKGFPKGQYKIRVNLGTGQWPEVEIGLK